MSPSTDPDLPTQPAYVAMQRDVVALVETARQAAARHVNALMSATYWEIGRRIVESEQQGAARAEYGDALIERLAQDLTATLGRGVSASVNPPIYAAEWF